MAGPTQPPEITIKDLLEDEWDSSNTHGVTPQIHTGDYNDRWGGPQISILESDEGPLGGGTTGRRATDPTGSGGVSIVIGDIDVVAWAHNEFESISTGAERLAYSMSEEVRRILRNNELSPGHGLDWITFKSRVKRMDTRANPTLYRYDCRVTYKYEDRP